MIRVLNNSSDLSTWYYKPAVVDGDGTQSSPFNWLEQSTDGGTSITCNLVNSGDHNWYVFSLTGGTTYNFTSYSSSYPVSIRIYLQSDPDTVLADRQYTGSGSESFSFVPSTSDLYLFEMYSDPNACSSCTGTSPATISPIPNEISAEGGYEKKLIDMSTGIDDVGYLFNYQDLVDSDLLHKTIPTDGLVFYASLKEDSTKPEIGNSWTSKSSNITYQEVDGILCATFNTGSLRTSCSQDFGTNKVTLSSWFKKIQNSGTTACFLVYGSDSTYRVAGLQEASGYFALERGSGRWTTSFAMDESWHHYACTIDDTVIKLYVDGVNVYETTQSMNLSLDTLAIGSWISGSYNVKGYIAGCRVYNRPLLDKEIISLSKEFKI